MVNIEKGLVFMLLSSLLASLVGCGGWHYASVADVGELVCVLDERYATDSVTAVAINYSQSGNSIVVKESNDGKIHVKEFINANRSRSEMARIDLQNGTLIICGADSKSRNFSGRLDYLEIMLPADFVGCLTLQTTSGSVIVNHLKQADLTIITSSGSAWLNDVNGKVNCKTTSGSIDMAGDSFYGIFSTVSGSINMKVDAFAGNLSVTSTSGPVNVTVPQNIGFTYQIVSASGQTGSEFGGVSGCVNGGGYSLTLSTISGSVQLNKGSDIQTS